MKYKFATSESACVVVFALLGEKVRVRKLPQRHMQLLFLKMGTTVRTTFVVGTTVRNHPALFSKETQNASIVSPGMEGG